MKYFGILFRYFGGLLSEPAIKLVFVKIAPWLLRYQEWMIGECIFRGDGNFLKIATKAAGLLEESDPALFQEVIKSKLFILQHVDEPVVNFINLGIGGIPKQFIKWEAEGLASLWVLFYFSVKANDKGRWYFAHYENSVQRSRDAYLHTKRWLARNDFPEPLADCF